MDTHTIYFNCQCMGSRVTPFLLDGWARYSHLNFPQPNIWNFIWVSYNGSMRLFLNFISSCHIKKIPWAASSYLQWKNVVHCEFTVPNNGTKKIFHFLTQLLPSTYFYSLFPGGDISVKDHTTWQKLLKIAKCLHFPFYLLWLFTQNTDLDRQSSMILYLRTVYPT